MSDTATDTATARGDETRRRILGAALVVFGTYGFERATTRRIADRAGVALPAIRYYFDHKAGLYLACAHEIVSRYQAEVGATLRSMVADLDGGCSPEMARTHLKSVMRRVAMIAEGTGSEAATSFVLREMSEPGPAFDILYRELWQPGVQLTAALIARVRGLPGPDDEAHLYALMLHASLSAFTVTLPVSVRYLGEEATTAERDRQRAAALQLLDVQIDHLGPVRR